VRQTVGSIGHVMMTQDT